MLLQVLHRRLPDVLDVLVSLPVLGRIHSFVPSAGQSSECRDRYIRRLARGVEAQILKVVEEALEGSEIVRGSSHLHLPMRIREIALEHLEILRMPFSTGTLEPRPEPGKRNFSIFRRCPR